MSEEDILDEDALQQIYTWIDNVPLSRPKKNIARDFSDGVLVAEIVHHFISKIVDLHNYTAAHSTAKKMDNWNVLSRKCFSKLGFNVKDSLVKGAVFSEPGAIELILRDLRYSIESYIAKKKAQALLEKNEVHDELSFSSNTNGYTEHPSGHYDTQSEQCHTQCYANEICYPARNGEDFFTAQQKQQQQQYFSRDQSNEGTQFRYQSPPHSLNSSKNQGTAEKSSPTNQVSKARKPVTQITKSSKPKVSAANDDPHSLRLALEEKEQALLASQETVQILYAKIRRLEHLLHLKDIRLNEIKQQQHLPQHTFPTNNNPPPLPPQPYSHPNAHHVPTPTHGLQNVFPSPRPPLPRITKPSGGEYRVRYQR